MYLGGPWKLLPTTCVAKVEVLDLQHLCLSNLLHTLPKLGNVNIFFKLFEHKTNGAKINNLAALQMNLLKRCVNNWYDKSSLIVIYRRISWYIVSLNLFLGNSGNIRFNVKLICHSHRLFGNYVGLLANIFSQMLNIFNTCIDILVCINNINCASLKLLHYSAKWV